MGKNAEKMSESSISLMVSSSEYLKYKFSSKENVEKLSNDWRVTVSCYS